MHTADSLLCTAETNTMLQSTNTSIKKKKNKCKGKKPQWEICVHACSIRIINTFNISHNYWFYSKHKSYRRSLWALENGEKMKQTISHFNQLSAFPPWWIVYVHILCPFLHRWVGEQCGAVHFWCWERVRVLDNFLSIWTLLN